ncbi:type I restriction endonuclease [Helicobacter pylori]|uniref:type I restriction endonuclease n=1 Tax=Helicobacter pylori TaxID=210 RepID=UPI0027385EBE|nr:type I restriction endonuclease subunit R [Helicobacter pylori]
MPYNEITRVQVPALMHLAELGYDFIPAKNKPNLDTATNILTDSFTKSFERLNPTKNAQDSLTEMKKRLNYDDLGKSFYEYLLKSENQIIDFDNPNNNLYEMMAELPYKSFRPDITLFINGLPLVNIEVKQPLAGQGIKEEKDRHIQRYENPENKVFYNLAQIWLFSDNLPYDENNPDQGVFYSASYSPIFQRFVEANRLDITPPPPPENDQSHQNHQNHKSLEEIQKSVLNEFNLKDTDTPKSPKDTPTNSLLTSFCSHKRLCFILKYGISFLKEKSEFKKHIWRYAQMFASLNVLKELQKHYETNPKDPLKGIIWHTQGSGKTALTYHLTKLIRDFFSQSNLNKKTKFYFIVDRLDLLEQAKNEFSKRGLCVHEAENKEDLSQKLKNSSVFEGPQGNDEIIVVNIQKFKSPNEEKAPNEDLSNSAPKEIISKTELQESIQNSRNLQRVFIIDEAHRSYDPKGCFYANLIECDKTAVKIALTGTPLLEDNAQDKATRNTFGNYLHTYSYAESIKDRHTLKLQLEIIEKSYKEKLQAIYRLLQESITIEDIEVKKERIFNHEKYIKAMLYYIIRDLLNFRRVNNDENLKAMVICFSSAQARLANLLFNEVQEKVLQENPNLKILNKLQSSLILHDEQEVKEKIHSFKHKDTDIVFVFNMLLTGFDLPSLKRLYIHRELKDHNLLQALARVNRSYNNMSFGYLIDFVGIKENYDKTTDDYLKELNQFNQGDFNDIKDMFADRNILEKDIKNAYDDLFNYPIDDVEAMTSAIVSISAMNELLKVSRAINTLKERYNLIRTSNDEKILSLKEKMDIEKISKISSMLHKKAKHLHALKNINEPKNPNDLMILEDLIALLDFKIEFKERKELRFKEQEEITTKQKQAKEILEKIPDKQDKEIQKISKELSKLLQEPLTNHNFDGISHSYSAIISQLKQHKEQTTNLLSKYDNDLSYVITHKRLHDRLMEENISKGIFTLLSALKKALDARISKRQEILNEETTLKNAIKAELMDAFNKDPSLKDLEKEEELIVQTLFNELPKNYNQGNSHA